MAYRSLDGAGPGLETLDLGGPHLGRGGVGSGGVGSRGVALATTRCFGVPYSLLAQHAHRQARSRGSTMQATHQGTQMARSGDLTGLPLHVLEDPLG